MMVSGRSAEIIARFIHRASFFLIPIIFLIVFARYACRATGHDDMYLMLWTGRALLDHPWFVNYNFEYQEMSSSIIGSLFAYFAYVLVGENALLMCKIMGISAAIATLLVYFASRQVFFTAKTPYAMLIAMGWTILTPPYFFWAGGVLEEPYYALLLAIYGCSFAALSTRYSHAMNTACSMALVLLLLVRPETFWCLVLHAFLLYVLPMPSRARRLCALGLLIPVVFYLGLLIFRWHNFGYVFPIPVYAKATFFQQPLDTLRNGISYLLRYYYSSPLNWGECAAFAYAAWVWLHSLVRKFMHKPLSFNNAQLIITAIFMAYMTALVMRGGDWMGNFRPIMTVAPIQHVVFMMLVAQVCSRERTVMFAQCGVVFIIITNFYVFYADSYKNNYGCKRVTAEMLVTHNFTELNDDALLEALNYERNNTLKHVISAHLADWVQEKGHLTILLNQAGFFPYEIRSHYPQYNDGITFVDPMGLIQLSVAQQPVGKSVSGVAEARNLLQLLLSDTPYSKLIRDYHPNVIYNGYALNPYEISLFKTLGYRSVVEDNQVTILLKDE